MPNVCSSFIEGAKAHPTRAPLARYTSQLTAQSMLDLGFHSIPVWLARATGLGLGPITTLAAALALLLLLLLLLLLPRCCASRAIRVIVVRHASEVGLRRKAMVASTPVLQSVLGSRRCTVIDAPKSEVLGQLQVAVLRAAAAQPSTLLLFPSSDSVSLEDVASEDRGGGGGREGGGGSGGGGGGGGGGAGGEDASRQQRTPPRTLVVVDGSWKTAGTLIRKNRVLWADNMRHVHLPPGRAKRGKRGGTSAYMTTGLRTEPRQGFVSTAEATAVALDILSDGCDAAFGAILDRFDAFARAAAKAILDGGGAVGGASAKKIAAMARRKRQCAQDGNAGGRGGSQKAGGGAGDSGGSGGSGGGEGGGGGVVGQGGGASSSSPSSEDGFEGREWALLDVMKCTKKSKASNGKNTRGGKGKAGRRKKKS